MRAHSTQRRAECALERGQEKLRDARIHLAHEGADGDDAYDQPTIGGKLRQRCHRWGFAPLQNGVPDRRDRPSTSIHAEIGLAPSVK